MRIEFSDGTVLDGSAVTGSSLLSRRLRVEILTVLGVVGRPPVVDIDATPGTEAEVTLDNDAALLIWAGDIARMCGERIVSPAAEKPTEPSASAQWLPPPLDIEVF